ncbi:hypothetical protein M8J75_004923 [Diaphorina citri]|nr:hypothetical protein M8J75_004923 [Diaphorina citri]
MTSWWSSFALLVWCIQLSLVPFSDGQAGPVSRVKDDVDDRPVWGGDDTITEPNTDQGSLARSQRTSEPNEDDLDAMFVTPSLKPVVKTISLKRKCSLLVGEDDLDAMFVTPPLKPVVKTISLKRKCSLLVGEDDLDAMFVTPPLKPVVKTISLKRKCYLLVGEDDLDAMFVTPSLKPVVKTISLKRKCYLLVGEDDLDAMFVTPPLKPVVKTMSLKRKCSLLVGEDDLDAMFLTPSLKPVVKTISLKRKCSLLVGEDDLDAMFLTPSLKPVVKTISLKRKCSLLVDEDDLDAMFLTPPLKPVVKTMSLKLPICGRADDYSDAVSFEREEVDDRPVWRDDYIDQSDPSSEEQEQTQGSFNNQGNLNSQGNPNNQFQDFQGNPNYQFQGNSNNQDNPNNQFQGNPNNQFQGNSNDQGNPAEQEHTQGNSNNQDNPNNHFQGNPNDQGNSFNQGNPNNQFQGNPTDQEQTQGNSNNQFQGTPNNQFQGNPDNQFQGNPNNPFQGNPNNQFQGNPNNPFQGNPTDQGPLGEGDRIIKSYEVVEKEQEEEGEDDLQNMFITPSLRPVVTTISLKHCLNYCKFPAGVPSVSGGVDSNLFEFPHMGALGYESTQDRSAIGWNNCGGTLISRTFVLTAAHCIDSSLGPPSYVRLGEHDLSRTNEGASPVDYSVLRVFVHPDYNATLSNYNDIALLQLRTRVNFTQYIRPACLHHRDVKGETDGKNLTEAVVTGWGNTGFADAPSDILQKVTVDLIDSTECNKYYPADKFIPNGVLPTQLCAGVLAGGKDACVGDSGGPLQVNNTLFFAVRECPMEIIGITSFGRYCAQKNSPGIYTDVASFVPWIESIVWPNRTKTK